MPRQSICKDDIYPGMSGDMRGGPYTPGHLYDLNGSDIWKPYKVPDCTDVSSESAGALWKKQTRLCACSLLRQHAGPRAVKSPRSSNDMASDVRSNQRISRDILIGPSGEPEKSDHKPSDQYLTVFGTRDGRSARVDGEQRKTRPSRGRRPGFWSDSDGLPGGCTRSRCSDWCPNSMGSRFAVTGENPVLRWSDRRPVRCRWGRVVSDFVRTVVTMRSGFDAYAARNSRSSTMGSVAKRRCS